MNAPAKINGVRHARLGPSSSEIWLTCESAPARWKLAPAPKPGPAARQGTLAHTLCEAALIKGRLGRWLDMTFLVEGEPVVVDQEMLDAVSLYAAYVSSIRDSGWRAVESEVSLAWLWDKAPSEEIFGTADFAASAFRVLHVVDFKYGRGKAVDPEKNPQLSCYGVGAFGQLKREKPEIARHIDTVRLTIVQPRAGSRPVREWETPLGDLMFWAYGALRPAVDRILRGKPGPLTPGSHCWFCAASADCEAYRSHRAQREIGLYPDWVDEEEI